MPMPLRESIYRARKLPRDEQILLGRAELLDRVDRDLIEAVLVHGQSCEALGRMMGCCGRTVRRRVQVLSRRLTSRRFLDAARALPHLDGDEAKLAKLIFCQGHSRREVARKSGVSQHCVRRRVDRLAAKIQTIRDLTRSGLLTAGR